MKLIAITDLHDHQAVLRRILSDAGSADAILLGGDLTNFGSPADAERLVQEAQTTGITVWAVAGNCDSAEIDQRLVELGVSLMGRGVIEQEVGLHGLSAMPPWRSDMYQFTEDELAQALQAGHKSIGDAKHHVVLSHSPPQNMTVDRTMWDDHVGSSALREFIETTQPDLVFCGHIHEARSVEKLGRTTVVNCGPAATGFYATAEVGSDVKVELRQA
jgi:Icc-related predicted phosphoesterase